jgi:hypothetical protein
MKESKELQYQDLLLEFERWRLKEAKFEIKHLKASLEVLKSQLKLSSLLVEKVISQRDELIFASQGHREKAASITKRNLELLPFGYDEKEHSHSTMKLGDFE